MSNRPRISFNHPQNWPLRGAYFAPDALLPEKLPTLRDIDLHRKHSHVIEERGDRTVVRVGGHFIVKAGTSVNLIEGETHLFLRKCYPDLPIPEIYAFYRDGDSGINVIITEYIDGQALDLCASRLTQEEWRRVGAQLKQFLAQIRGIPAPSYYYGRLGGHSLRSFVFCDPRSPNHRSEATRALIEGPFNSEDAFNEALYIALMAHTGWSDQAMYYWLDVFPRVLTCHSPIFTHGDLRARNVILRPDGRIVVIDFESAGWLPSYWEYATSLMFHGAPWSGTWHRVIKDAINGEKYAVEHVVLDTVCNAMRRERSRRIQDFRASGLSALQADLKHRGQRRARVETHVRKYYSSDRAAPTGVYAPADGSLAESTGNGMLQKAL